MYQELPFVAAIIITKIHSSSMVIPFAITPSGLTAVKKNPKVSACFEQSKGLYFYVPTSNFLNNFVNNNRECVEVSFTSGLKWLG